MAKPSILFLNRTYPPVRSTSGRLLRDLARAFEESGWDVTILTTHTKAVHDRESTIKLIKIAVPGNAGNMFVSFWIWLKIFCAAFFLPKPDVLITMSDPPMLAIAGHWLSKIKKVPHVHWCQELYPDIFPALDITLPSFLMRILKSLTRRAMNNCEKVVVPGRCMARHLLRSGVARQKITHIANWADLTLAEAAEENAGSILSNALSTHGTRPAFPYDDSPKFRVMHTGHIKPFHAMKTILEAARILDQENPEIEFVFVGTGAPFDLLVEERGRLGLHNIRLMPFQPAEQVELVMKMGDVHIISLKNAAGGLTIPRRLHTAFAVERPCIFMGPDISEAALLIREYNAGKIIAPDDTKALVNAIRHYRHEGGEWFTAQKGATAAGHALTPDKSIRNWIAGITQILAPYKKSDLKN